MGGLKKRRATDRQFSGALSDRVRHARRLAGLTQAALAQQLGVVPSAVAQWERPGGTAPTVAHLSHMATLTKVTFEWLATGRGGTHVDPDSTPAVDPASFAFDLTEERLLVAFRKFSAARRDAIVKWLDEMS